MLVFCVIILAACLPPSNPPAVVVPQDTFEPVKLGPTSTPTSLPASRIPITPSPTLRPIEPISSADWRNGPEDAPIQILVYSDFQCPYCASFAGVLGELERLHTGQILIIFRHFPLANIHDKAFMAAQVAEAAGAQNAFWAMHDRLFDTYATWVTLPPEEFLPWALEQARQLGLDQLQMEDELAAGVYTQRIRDAYNHALESGIPGTPFIFLNGYWFRLDPSLDNLEAAIRLELVSQNQLSSPPVYELDLDAVYLATLVTNLGEIQIQLFPREAPQTVGNFLGLAELGWYDGNAFYEVIPGRLAATGDPSGTGFGSPGYSFKDEISSTLSFAAAGMVAMSSMAPDTNGSRFFVSLSPLPELNGSRTIFGRVISGMEHLQELPARDPSADLLQEPAIIIERVEVVVR
jgi:cyclophilin family peptidyl-prolyl cis-trans isomerase/protein-disulfide isomerase